MNSEWCFCEPTRRQRLTNHLQFIESQFMYIDSLFGAKIWPNRPITVTANSKCYWTKLIDWFSEGEDINSIWCIQDGATCHTVRASIDNLNTICKVWKNSEADFYAVEIFFFYGKQFRCNLGPQGRSSCCYCWDNARKNRKCTQKLDWPNWLLPNRLSWPKLFF